jgi:DNA-binding NtrC family response regulator
MALASILFISDQASSRNSVLAALEATGYEVVGTNSATQAIALLFIMRSVAAVVLHYRVRERTGFDLLRSLRAIRPRVPIILLYRQQLAHCHQAWMPAEFTYTIRNSHAKTLPLRCSVG